MVDTAPIEFGVNSSFFVLSRGLETSDLDGFDVLRGSESDNASAGF